MFGTDPAHQLGPENNEAKCYIIFFVGRRVCHSPIEVPLARLRDLKPLAATSTVGEARCLTPAERILMKGANACTALVEAALTGTPVVGKDRLAMIDYNPNSSGDWIMASLNMQGMKKANQALPHTGLLTLCTNEQLFSPLKAGAEKVFVEEWWFKRPESGCAEPAQNLDADRSNPPTLPSLHIIINEPRCSPSCFIFVTYQAHSEAGVMG